MAVAVELLHTASLRSADLVSVRRLMDVAFDDFDDDDWGHALGGLHALVRDGDEVVAHAAVVARRLLLGGRGSGDPLHGARSLRCGYVEAVAVAPTHRRQGLGRAVFGAVDDVVVRGYDVGALGATDDAVPLYESFGWVRFPGRAFAFTPGGVARTADDEGAIFVRAVPGVTLDLHGDLVADPRPGDVW